MFLSNASIKRPVAMGCLLIGLALLGLNAFRKINLELFPNVDMPIVTVTAIYPGATPDEIEIDIARRIEDAVASIDGLKSVLTTSMENMCQVLLEFEMGVDVDIAAMDVREQIDMIRSDFPAAVEDPIILKFDINAKPVVTLALTGEAGVDELYDYADNQLSDRLSAILGVADVTLIGGDEREVHILLDREALAARGLTSAQVIQAVQRGVGTIPSGRLRHGGSEYSVKFRAEYDDMADLENLEIVNREGHRCYLRDIGQAVTGMAELRQESEIDGRPAVALKVVKRADANAVAVVRSVERAVETIRRDLPGGMELVWVTDDRAFTEAMNADAWINVLQGVLMTGAILFFFLYNIRTLFVVAVTMPLTIVIGVLFMHAMAFSLNAVTLIAITMSVGILVTNSIVVIEAIVDHLDKTGDPVRAARDGAAEAFIPVLASAGTNMVVLLPLSIMGSMMGIMVRYFALTLLILTAVSLFISFTLTPMLCALLLTPRSDVKHGVLFRMEQGWNRGLNAVLGAYRLFLTFLEQRRWAAILVVLAVVGMLAHSVWLAGRFGSEFSPDSDRGEVYVKLEFPTHYSLAQTRTRVQSAQHALEGLPHLRHMLTTIGKVDAMLGQSSEGVHLAQILLRFNERTERTVTIQQLMGLIRERLHDLPDMVATVSVPSPIGGQESGVEMEIAGPDLAELDRLALAALEVAREVGVADVDTTVRVGKPELRVEPRRAVLSDMGMAPMDMGMILRGNIEGITAGTFKKDARNYDIVVKMVERESIDQVGAFAFPGEPGRPMSLDGLATLQEHSSPVQIIRKDKQRVSKLFGNLTPDLPMGTAVARISSGLEEGDILPPDYRHQFVGMYEKLVEAQGELAEAAIIALILVFLVLAAILESFKQPFLILVTVPVTVIGIVWSLALTGGSMEFFVLMSAVMMMGIVVNNAILIMDQFNIHVAEGIPRHKAMINAASERFRPVVMITVAAVLGMLPMAMSRGIGAEMRNAAGIASVGGILVSGILTLILLPILYDLCTRKPKNGVGPNHSVVASDDINTAGHSDSDDLKGGTT